MSAKFNRLIKQLWPDDEASQKIAHKFVEKFANMPMAADRVEPLLREGARIDEMIRIGSMTRDEGQNALNSFMSEGLGTPPHILAEISTWSDGITADLAAAETPPDSATEAEKTAAQPLPQNASADSAASASAGKPAGQPASASLTVAPVRSVTPSRAELQAEVAKWQAAMRSPEGSAEWRSYWRGDGQQAYLAALQGLETTPETTAPSIIAGGADAPEPEARSFVPD